MPPSARSGHPWRVAGVIFVVATLIHGVAVWVPSYWYDEAAMLRLARLPLSELLRFLADRDAVHGAYALMLHGWIALFGESELATRAPSVLATAISTAGAFLLAYRLGARTRSALLAAIVFCFLPRTFIQSAEARSYALATALVVVAALLVLLAVRGRRTWAWLGYLVVMSLAILTFAYSVLLLPAFLLLVLPPLQAGAHRWITGALTALPALTAIPLAAVLFAQRGQVAWLTTQDLNAYTVLLEPFFGAHVILAVAGTALLAVGLPRAIARFRMPVTALAVWILFPMVALLLAGLVTQPLFTPRYLTICTPAFAILCALATTWMSARVTVAISLAWALAATPMWVASRAETAKPSGQALRTIANLIQNGAKPGDGFLLGNTGTGALRPRTLVAAYPHSFDGMTDVAFVAPFTRTGTYWDELRVPPARSLTEARIWTATRGKDSFDSVLRAAGFHVTGHTLITGIRVSLWERG